MIKGQAKANAVCIESGNSLDSPPGLAASGAWSFGQLPVLANF